MSFSTSAMYNLSIVFPGCVGGGGLPLRAVKPEVIY